MMRRHECSITGCLMDEDDDGWYVWCAVCGWNGRVTHGGAAAADQLLVEHFEAEHARTPSFVWLNPDERVARTMAAKA